MTCFSTLRPIKNDVRFEYVSRKNVWFCFISNVWVQLVIKLRNFDFESDWNALVFFDQKNMGSDLNICHGKMSDFVSFLLFGFTLVIKLRNFEFENHWNTLIFCNKKMMSDLDMPYQTVSDLVKAFLFVLNFWQQVEKYEF